MQVAALAALEAERSPSLRLWSSRPEIKHRCQIPVKPNPPAK